MLFIQTGHQDPSGVVADPGRQDQQDQTHITRLDQSEGQTQNKDSLREEEETE